MAEPRRPIRPRALVACCLAVLAAGAPGPARAKSAARYGPRPPAACPEGPWPRALDGALCDGARRIALAFAGAPAGHRGAAARARQVAFLLHQAGVADAQVRPSEARGKTAAAVLARLRSAAGDAPARAILGAAVVPDRRRFLGVLLVDRRLVRPAPFPRVLAGPGPLVVAGRLAPGARGPTAFATRPDGTVVRYPVATRGRRFRVVFSLVPAGRWTVEVLADDGMGPEAALLAPIAAGVAPAIAPPPVIPAGRGDPAAAVVAAVYRLRRAHHRSAPARDPVLDRIAARKARLIAKVGRPVHRPGPGTGIVHALAAAGYAFSWAGEDLAAGPGPMACFAGLLDSPAHRGALLDFRAERLGVGLARRDHRTYLAVVLAEPMHGRPVVDTATARAVRADRLAFRAETAVDAARAERHLGAAVRDPTLDDDAAALAAHLAAADLGDDAAATAALRRRLRAADPTVTGVDVAAVVAGRPEAVTRAPAILDPACDRLGLAVRAHASRRFGGERLWIVAICAAHGGTP